MGSDSHQRELIWIEVQFVFRYCTPSNSHQPTSHFHDTCIRMHQSGYTLVEWQALADFGPFTTSATRRAASADKRVYCPYETSPMSPSNDPIARFTASTSASNEVTGCILNCRAYTAPLTLLLADPDRYDRRRGIPTVAAKVLLRLCLIAA